MRNLRRGNGQATAGATLQEHHVRNERVIFPAYVVELWQWYFSLLFVAWRGSFMKKAFKNNVHFWEGIAEKEVK